MVRKLASEFIHPGVGSEVVAAGLNSIREVCRRQPWAMEEDLLGDLVDYRKSRDKAVTAAARGLLQLYREVNPGMLKRRERVRVHWSHRFVVGSHMMRYRVKLRQWAWRMVVSLWPLVIANRLPWMSKVLWYVFCHHLFSLPCADDLSYFQLLEDHLKQLRAEEGIESGDEKEDDEAAWEGWDVESDSSDSSSDAGDWINVDSDGEDHLSFSDSDDEDGKKKKNLKGKAKADEDGDGESVAAAPEPDRISSLATTKVTPVLHPRHRASTNIFAL